MAKFFELKSNSTNAITGSTPAIWTDHHVKDFVDDLNEIIKTIIVREKKDKDTVIKDYVMTHRDHYSWVMTPCYCKSPSYSFHIPRDQAFYEGLSKNKDYLEIYDKLSEEILEAAKISNNAGSIFRNEDLGKFIQCTHNMCQANENFLKKPERLKKIKEIVNHDSVKNSRSIKNHGPYYPKELEELRNQIDKIESKAISPYPKSSFDEGAYAKKFERISNLAEDMYAKAYKDPKSIYETKEQIMTTFLMLDILGLEETKLKDFVANSLNKQEKRFFDLLEDFVQKEMTNNKITEDEAYDKFFDNFFEKLAYCTRQPSMNAIKKYNSAEDLKNEVLKLCQEANQYENQLKNGKKIELLPIIPILNLFDIKKTKSIF